MIIPRNLFFTMCRHRLAQVTKSLNAADSVHKERENQVPSAQQEARNNRRTTIGAHLAQLEADLLSTRGREAELREELRLSQVVQICDRCNVYLLRH
jgi:hypothetical protein